ncbi:cytochrome P450 [Podospora appendiculata]|uniref:Cytochrome P450 n=1 Tax=Podospora appendiculata TaxID=314037 RepID=A0AAE0X6F4_9PEZI|nr:cytochrome P450 [Podospora appendiculata]
MVSSVLAGMGVALAFTVYVIASGWRSNIQKARKTGLPYIIVPIHPFNPAWQLTFWFWKPLIMAFPKSWWEGWLFVLLPNWEYVTRQEHFKRLGSDSFVVASPGDLTMFTNDADAIHQITMRREAFPKDVARYGVLAMFGSSVLTTEGSVWRMHRKVTSASFNEKNAAHTFAEAIRQTRGMIDLYFRMEGGTANSTKTITTLEHDTMTWALNIIGYVGFGLRLLWPGQELPEGTDPKLVKYGSHDPPPGFSLTFGESLAGVLDSIVTLLVVNWGLLKLLPFSFAKKAHVAKEDYLKYMAEFLHDKMEDVQAGSPPKDGMDIMGQLVRSKYGKGDGKDGQAKLEDSEIIGNAFIMTLAGHETTANTLHFTLLELANNPLAQRRLQKDVDRLFGDSDPSTWDYEKNVNAMLASHIGACINETLRMIPAVTQVPKIVSADSDQALVVGGEKRVLPAGMGITLVALCAQRNPHFWPTKPSERTGAATDLDDYDPERWYRVDSSRGGDSEEAEDEGEDYGGFKGENTSASMFRPARGSFIPFSDGPRSCLGRRIAMVELIAALAVIFQKYSIELAVDAWASDEQVAAMGAQERRQLYRRAQDKCRATIDEATTVITLKLNGGKHVPVRLVRRGSERFVRDEALL